MVYDVHAHGLPPQLVAALERGDSDVGIEVVARDDGRRIIVAGGAGGPLRTDFVDIDARIAFLNRSGIDVQLMSSWIGVVGYTLPAQQGQQWARMFNEALAEMVDEHRDRLRGLCNVPLQSGDLAAAELRYAVERLGMAGVEIATTVDGRDLDDPSLEPFWRAAADLRCLVLIHPDQTLPGRPQPRYFLNNLVGNAAETTIAVAHLLFSGVLERHPDLRLVLVHGGGYLPWQAGRLDHGYTAAPQQVARQIRTMPSEQLRRLYYDTVTHSPATLRLLLEFAGAEHVMLGSDYPFEMGQPDPIGLVDAVHGLSAADRRLILEGNVQRLLDDMAR